MRDRERPADQLRMIRWLIYLMFFMFAMTTDSVGLIIPQVVTEFHLDLTTAGALHYGSMLGIGFAGLGLGQMVDRVGPRRAILMGLTLFASTAFLLPAAGAFPLILIIITLAGVSIGMFKTGALALVGGISRSPTELTHTMNLVEGFFGVGAIVGPVIVNRLVGQGLSWRWLYALAGAFSLVLILVAAMTRDEVTQYQASVPRGAGHAMRLLRDPYVLGFSVAAFAYVMVECAVYVWMPTLFAADRGQRAAIVAYSLPAFFVMRAAGRFGGAWLLGRVDWTLALALCSTLIVACFAGSIAFGAPAATYLLPLTGLFMSIIYPTINSKGIACAPAPERGAVAGVMLFFTCAGAILGPLAMALLGDWSGGAQRGFVLATGYSGVLAVGCCLNWWRKPAEPQLEAFRRRAE